MARATTIQTPLGMGNVDARNRRTSQIHREPWSMP